jgi:mono/diheme cytochrome c family protein
VSVKRFVLIVVLLAVLAAAGALAWAMRHPEIAAIEPPDPAGFDPQLLERGEALVGIGNCAVCHTRTGGGRYAGGLPLPTPFGTIYTTNITPDPETGIGTWSEAAFIRAMRLGVDRHGRHLYPAFPYDYYTKTTDEDLQAIYAFLMTREPVSAEAPENELPFPFNIRLLLAGWNTLFLAPGAYDPDPNMDEEWNRGAYLVEGLGHCGACHTPRNIFGAAPKAGPRAYDGGEAEGWHAPPLNARANDPIPWTELALVDYLIDGWHGDHGIAAGPMKPVVNELYDQDEDDIFAMANYLLTLQGDPLPAEEREAIAAAAHEAAERLQWGHPDAPEIPDAPVLQLGARVFERECVECHAMGERALPLALTPGIHMADAANLVMVSFWGIEPAPRGVPNRSMPARHRQISDEEMVALAAFVRDRFSDLPPWEDIEATVRRAREMPPH